MTSSLAEWAAARRALAAQTGAFGVGIDRGRGVRFSGFVWDSETLVSAAEMLHGTDSVMVHGAHGSASAKVLACDLSVDVAVLKATTGTAGISRAEPRSLAAGDAVLIAGRGQSAPAIVWSQVEQVGPAWRSRRGGELDRLIRLSPGLHPTLEGAGAYDLEGRLCAMAVRGPRRSTLGIPIETVERIVAAVMKHGRLPQPYLGVRLQPVRLDASLREQLARKGTEAAIVVGVETDSPAAASLLFGDLILSVGGQPIENAFDLKNVLTRLPLGAATDIQVYRAGGTVDTTVIVQERSGA
jgi:S1-C subfamily serine protease